MARLALAAMAGGAWMVWADNGYSVPYGLEDKIWLVALLPAVYILCISLLRE